MPYLLKLNFVDHKSTYYLKDYEYDHKFKYLRFELTLYPEKVYSFKRKSNVEESKWRVRNRKWFNGQTISVIECEQFFLL